MQLGEAGALRVRAREVRAMLASRRLIQFSFVGATGVGVNTAVLYLLVQAGHLHYMVAAAIASEVAIISNFNFNDQWTFRDVGSRLSWLERLLRYNAIAVGGILVTLAVLAALTLTLGMPYLVANLFAIAAATIWNYLASSSFAWHARHSTSSSATAHPDPAGPESNGRRSASRRLERAG
jgi:putative flippase GtrA